MQRKDLRRPVLGPQFLPELRHGAFDAAVDAVGLGERQADDLVRAVLRTALGVDAELVGIARGPQVGKVLGGIIKEQFHAKRGRQATDPLDGAEPIRRREEPLQGGFLRPHLARKRMRRIHAFCRLILPQDLQTAVAGEHHLRDAGIGRGKHPRDFVGRLLGKVVHQAGLRSPLGQRGEQLGDRHVARICQPQRREDRQQGVTGGQRGQGIPVHRKVIPGQIAAVDLATGHALSPIGDQVVHRLDHVRRADVGADQRNPVLRELAVHGAAGRVGDGKVAHAQVLRGHDTQDIPAVERALLVHDKRPVRVPVRRHAGKRLVLVRQLAELFQVVRFNRLGIDRHKHAARGAVDGNDVGSKAVLNAWQVVEGLDQRADLLDGG